MRILTLIDAAFRRNRRGGMQTVAEELARRLAARGHQLTFLLPRTREIDSLGALDHVPDGISIVEFERGRTPFTYIRNGRRAMLELSRKVRFDVAHVHFAYAALGPGSTLAKDVPIVRSYHGAWDTEGMLEAKLDARRFGARARIAAVARYGIEYADLARSCRIITLSNFARRQVLQRFPIDAARVDEIPGGVGEQFVPATVGRSELRGRLNLPIGALIIVTACRLVEAKGVANLIDAVAQVVRRRGDTICVIAGDGPARVRLERRVVQLGLQQHVRFVGFLGDSLVQYYQSADVVINSSLAPETLGLVTLEALACGIPVVGTPVGATPQLLGAIDRRFIAFGTQPADLVKAIFEVIALRDSGAISSNVLATFVKDGFRWDRHADAFERVFEASRTAFRGASRHRRVTRTSTSFSNLSK